MNRPVDSIMENFQLLEWNNRSRGIKYLPEKFPAWTIKFSDGTYGVAVKYDKNKNIFEKSNQCIIKTGSYSTDDSGKYQNYLILITWNFEIRKVFSNLCAEFVETDAAGSERKELLNNPVKWWKDHIELLGDTISTRKPYSVIAEMLALSYLSNKNYDPEWKGPNGFSQDIETSNFDVEVKASLKKKRTDITINSQFQLDSKRLFLMFYRMEESSSGKSINDMVSILVEEGFSKDRLEMALSRLGYHTGSDIRNKKFKVIEQRIYEVDENFPRITASMFINGRLPAGITDIQYTVDLDSLLQSDFLL